VEYNTGFAQRKRPMQGQSPYLLNAGIFYQDTQSGWNFNAIYNHMGKRILVNGDYSSVSADAPQAYVPDIYEQSRSVLDLNLAKTVGKQLELRLSAKDLLSQPLRQTRTYFNGIQVEHARQEVAPKLFLTATYNF
jgi:hypothetical protein